MCFFRRNLLFFKGLSLYKQIRSSKSNNMATTSLTSESFIRPDLTNGQYGHASNLALNDQVKALIQQGQSIYHFGFGQSPFPAFEIAAERLKENVHQTEYLTSQGLLSLRQSIVNFHNHFDSMTFDPDDVIVGPGSKELILQLMLVFNGDVLMNSPSWTTYKPQAVLTGRPVITVESQEEDGWKITPQRLEKVLSLGDATRHKLLIFCNPCNPTGTSYSEQELKELTCLLRQYNVLVLSDEIYARLKFDRNHHSIAKAYPEGTILCSGFSKWASVGGYRLGYQVFPKPLRPLLSTLISVASHSFSCASAPIQFAFAEALQNLPGCEEYMAHCSRILQAVGAFSARTLRSAGLTVVESTAGYYIFPNFGSLWSALEARGVRNGQQLCDVILAECSVVLQPGGLLYLRPVSELTTRLCYVCFDGASALAASRRIGLSEDLDDSFVLDFCRPVYDGINVLKKWVEDLRATKD